MNNKKTKDSLLETPMDQLPLGKSFTRCFELGLKEAAPTLKEFIQLNPHLKYNEDFFRDPRVTYGLFNKKSKKWELLKQFLLKNGFTSNDWTMLIPKKLKSGRLVDDFSKVKKEQLLKLPIAVVCPGKTSAKSKDGTVENVLNLDESQWFLSLHYEGCSAIQKELRSLGFTKKDGPFMKVKFKSSKTKQQHIEFLISEKGFFKWDAVKAVEFGLKAGWIK